MVIAKKPFNNKEIVQLRYKVKKGSLSDAVILELLLSSGMRLGELVVLKVTDVNLSNKTYIVLGKDDKERICYFNETCKYSLRSILKKKEKVIILLYLFRLKNLIISLELMMLKRG